MVRRKTKGCCAYARHKRHKLNLVHKCLGKRLALISSRRWPLFAVGAIACRDLREQAAVAALQVEDADGDGHRSAGSVWSAPVTTATQRIDQLHARHKRRPNLRGAARSRAPASGSLLTRLRVPNPFDGRQVVAEAAALITQTHNTRRRPAADEQFACKFAGRPLSLATCRIGRRAAKVSARPALT